MERERDLPLVLWTGEEESMEREWERKRDVRLGTVQRKMYVFE